MYNNRQKVGKKSPGRNVRNTVVVVVRVRPLTPYELRIDSSNVVQVKNEQVVTIRDPKNKENLNDPLYRSKESKYAFDVALDTKATNRQLYDRAVKDVVTSVMKGKHGTVFAYGATGHGKTYTMSGSGPQNPGVMYFTISDLFRAIEKHPKPVKVSASYLEIYNETLIDLLSDVPTTLDIREDRQRGITISGITEYSMECAESVFDVLEKGQQNRTTDSHALNDASSRSHAVLMITVAQLSKNGKRVEKSANLTMIDLAGSERAKKTGTDKKTLREAAKINRSLLSLANCINALAVQKKGLYIPYRDSKLTRLLKESLGGGAHTVMIANVSSASSQFDEVRETLLYANRAKNIKVTSKMMEKVTAEPALTRQEHAYAQLVTDLQNDLCDLKDTLTPNRSLHMDLSMSLSSPLQLPPPLPSTSPPVVSLNDDDDSVKRKQQRPQEAHAVSSESRRSELVVPAKTTKHQSVPMSAIAKHKPQFTRTMQTWKETQQLVEKIVSNFQDRIQIRRSLVELDEVDAFNNAELSQYDSILRQPHLTEQQREQLLTDRESVQSTLRENAEYRRRQTDELLELKVDGAQLRRALDNQAPLNEDREQIVHLTLDRCVLEVQKMDMELRDRAQTRALTVKSAEADYYRQLLSKNNVNFQPFDPNNVARAPLPAAPVLSSPGAKEPTHKLDSRVRAALATPKMPIGSNQNGGGGVGFSFTRSAASTPSLVAAQYSKESHHLPAIATPPPSQSADQKPKNHEFVIHTITPRKQQVRQTPEKCGGGGAVPAGALRALKTKLRGRRGGGGGRMPKSQSCMDISSPPMAAQWNNVRSSVQLPSEGAAFADVNELDHFVLQEAIKRDVSPQSRPRVVRASASMGIEEAAHRRVANGRRWTHDKP